MAERIDRYELLATLGQGALGVVYLAKDTKLDREVAIKVMSPAVADSETARMLFHREAKAIAKLSHPNIITLYDYATEPRIYLVVERLRGQTLGDVSKPIEPFTAAAIGYEIALGLAHAHEQGIVHRDLKPENIFIEPDGRVVLCDFGVARAYRTAAVHTLASHQTKLAGSPLYMSPEQILDPTSIGPASDLFSLGSVLFFLLTGEHAFQQPNLHKVLKAVTERQARPLDGPLGPVIARCHDKDPERRYGTARQLADALLAVSKLQDPRRLIRTLQPARQTHAPSHTMITLKKKAEVVLLDKPKTVDSQNRVLLWAVAIALTIVATALLLRLS